jgi:four helix bundle protein
MNYERKDLRFRTKAFALSAIRMYSSLPKSTEAQVLGKQVLRSGTSVGANYREACRSRSKAEFVAKLGDCLKELDESSYWFELLEESGTSTSANIEPLKKECNELLAIFTSIAKKCKTAEAKL